MSRVRANLRAIQLARFLENQKRHATPQEKRLLASYTGWGGTKEAFNEFYGNLKPFDWSYSNTGPTRWRENWGDLYTELRRMLKAEEWKTAADSTLNAHYTSAQVASLMWKMAEQVGFKGGKVLEPSAGTGVLLTLMPAHLAQKSRVTAIELDNLTGRILSQIHPEAEVLVEGFEKAKLRRHSFDLAIANVPFGETHPNDDSLPLRFNLHNYFLAKMFQYLKPGGVLISLTSAYTMDAIQNAQRAQRKFISDQAELIAAYRLPDSAFKQNAQTEVVTDLLILRKPDGRRVSAESWTGVQEFLGASLHDGEPPSRHVNEYYWAHPDHVLGKHSFDGRMYANNHYTVRDDPERPFLARLEALIPQLPNNVFSERSIEMVESPPSQRADRAAKEFSYQLDASGRVQQVIDGLLAVPAWSGTKQEAENEEVARGFIGLRESFKSLIATELDPAKSEIEVEDQRNSLRKDYEAFVLRYGHLNAMKSKVKFLDDDPEYDAVLGLENARDTYLNGKKGRECSPAPILTTRTLRPTVRPTTAETVEDAFLVSMGYDNKVNLPLMGALLSRDNDLDGIQEELIARALAFEDPATGQIQPAPSYLSGNVRKKLRDARIANERELAATGYGRYQKNIDALEPLVPREKVMGEFKVKLGATWVPAHFYGQFATSILGGEVVVQYRSADDRYAVNPLGCQYSSQNLNDYGYSGRSGHEIFKLVLNQQPLIHEDIVENADRSVRKIYNPEKTALLRQAANRMVAGWETYIVANEKVAHELTRIFNEKFNSHRPPVYNGSYLPLPGLSSAVRRTTHQLCAVSRNLQERCGLLAHDVGFGKSFTKIITCMELRRLGLARKPMIVVENSTLGQYAASFRAAYPQANILVANERNFSKQNRRRFTAAIATHDWDAIIVAQSQFDLLPNSVKMVEAFSAEQLEAYKDTLLDATVEGDRLQIRQARKALVSWEKRIEKQIENLQKRQDNMLAFDQLGVDFLFVDESHRYKKMPFSTKLGRIKGVDLTVSQRGLNLAMKAKWLHQQHDGRHVIGATGTPVSNTLAESWNMLRLTSPHLLQEFGVETFDRFASAFCMQKTAPELNESTNTWRVVTRMSEFINGDGLRSLIRSSWDVQMDAGAIKLKLPSIRTGKPISVTMPITAPAEEVMNRIAEIYDLWEEMDAKDRLAYSYVPLVLMQYGLAGALDPRLADPALPDDPNSLVNRAVENIFSEYRAHAARNAAQLVFADSYRPITLTSLSDLMAVTIEDGDGRVDGEEDEAEEQDLGESKESKQDAPGFNLYTDIRDKLTRKGIPAHQIAIVNDYSSRADKKALFDRVNSGDVRVLLGSTNKMGVGVNVQERLIAIHELAPPRDMTPASSRQRRGRIVRQGNTFDEVALYQYGMENTTVAGVFHRIERKEKSVVQVLMGYDDAQSFEDPASELMRSSAELKALCARDDRVLRKVELEEQIRMLAAERNAFSQKKFRDKESLNQQQAQKSWLLEFTGKVRLATSAIEEALRKTYPRPQKPAPDSTAGPPKQDEGFQIEDRPDWEDENHCMELVDEKGGVLVVEREELINAVDALLEQAINRSKAHGNLDRGVSFTLNAIPMRVKLQSISTMRSDAKFSLETFQPAQVIRSGGEINRTSITTPQGLLRSFRSLPAQLRKNTAESEASVRRLDLNILALEKMIADTPSEWPKTADFIEMNRELDQIDAALTSEAARRREERRNKKLKPAARPPVIEDPRTIGADSADLSNESSKSAIQRV